MAQEEWTEEEVEIVMEHFREELDKIRTADNLEDFIKNTNKGRIKQFLQDNLQASADGDRVGKDDLEARAVQKEELKDKVSNL